MRKLIVLFFALITGSVCHALPAASIFVSPTGDDHNPGTIDRPIRSLGQAQQLTRAFRLAGGFNQSDYIIILRGGNYYLDGTLTFAAEDGGTSNHQVIYQNYPGELPVLSGAFPVSNWRTTNDRGIYYADLPGAPPFRDIFPSDLNHTRPTRARWPKAGSHFTIKDYHWLNAPPNALYTQGIELNWDSRLDIGLTPYAGAELVIEKTFGQSRIELNRADVLDGHLLFMPQPELARAEANFINGIPSLDGVPFPAYFENSLSFLTAPGEWYFDNSSLQRLYYMPTEADRAQMPQATVYVPRLETLIQIGSPGAAPVVGIAFVGLAFRHTTLQGSVAHGYIATQGAHYRDSTNPAGEPKPMSGAIVVKQASNISFYRNHFADIGNKGLVVGNQTSNVYVAGNFFFDIGSSGVSIDTANDAPEMASGVYVADNYLYNIGYEFEGIGIFAGAIKNTTIARNFIRNASYSGISVGWGWSVGVNYTDVYYPNYSGNQVVNNDIGNVMTRYTDGGGIYTLPGAGFPGNNTGLLVRGNYIHDIYSATPGIGPVPAGIYEDHLSNGVQVIGNQIENVALSIFLQSSEGAQTIGDKSTWIYYEARNTDIVNNYASGYTTFLTGPTNTAAWGIGFSGNVTGLNTSITSAAGPASWSKSYWGQ